MSSLSIWDRGWQTFSAKELKAILLHVPSYNIGEKAQNVDTVSFFMRLRRDAGGLNCYQLNSNNNKMQI